MHPEPDLVCLCLCVASVHVRGMPIMAVLTTVSAVRQRTVCHKQTANACLGRHALGVTAVLTTVPHHYLVHADTPLPLLHS